MNIFVTGGSQGIGFSLVEEALRRDHRVFFTYFENRESADELLRRHSPEQLAAAYLDVRDSKAVDAVCDQAIKKFGTINGVINNAGVADSNLAVNVVDEEWDRVIRTNLYGSFFVARAFLPHLISQGFGSFVHLGSIDQNGARGNISYASSKSALIGLSGTLAKEYGRMGIRSNVIVPSFVETNMIHGRVHSKILESFFKDYSLTGEYIDPTDIAKFALFLCSDDARSINGAELPITAGLGWRP